MDLDISDIDFGKLGPEWFELITKHNRLDRKSIGAFCQQRGFQHIQEQVLSILETLGYGSLMFMDDGSSWVTIDDSGYSWVVDLKGHRRKMHITTYKAMSTSRSR
jgi:hypothetical protein